MRIRHTSDTPAWSDVAELLDELEPALDAVAALHPAVDVEVFFCVRCLPDEIGRKTFRRFSKDENVLYLDMTFSEEELSALDPGERRQRLWAELRRYAVESVGRYAFSGLDVAAFATDLDGVPAAVGWTTAD